MNKIVVFGTIICLQLVLLLGFYSTFTSLQKAQEKIVNQEKEQKELQTTIAQLQNSIQILTPQKNIVKYKTVGLLIVATGKYVKYVDPLVNSFEKYFLVDDTNYQVHYFIFTDGDIRERPHVYKLFQKRLGWPYDTMGRFQMYLSHQKEFEHMEYLYSVDSDLLCVANVTTSDIISDLVGTGHPGFPRGQRGTYETRPTSTAYVGNHEGEYYFFGAFWGGITSQVLTLCNTIRANIDKDLEKDIIAIWHDESHLNRYFIDHKPTKVLVSGYIVGEGATSPYKKIIQLRKNHADMRDCDDPQKVCKIEK